MSRIMIPIARPFTSTRRRLQRTLAATTTAVLVASFAGACDSNSHGEFDDGPTIVVGSYPVEYLLTRLLGDAAGVHTLARPGVDPHDLELTVDDVVRVVEADLVVTLGGFQHAVDDAIEEIDDALVLDLVDAVDLRPRPGSDAPDHHFWLDPERYGTAAAAIATRLVELLPDRRTDIEANLAALRADLEDLDREFAEGLATCGSRTIVTGHAAFGYLAERYGLTEAAIAGLEPEDEPSPSALADLVDLVRREGVTTIFLETLASGDIAETVASDTGARTAVLDPVEGITDASRGADYLEVMRANLTALRSGLDCE